MLKEFAIDPECFSSQERLKWIIESCGISFGRYVSDLPNGSWRRLVELQLTGKVSEQATRELLDQLKRRGGLFLTRCSEFSNWLDAARAEHARSEFSAIVTNRHFSQGCIDTDHLSIETEPWKSETGIRIQRTASELVRIAAPLIRLSTEVLLVDSYFDPSEPRYLDPTVAIVSAASEMNKTFDRFEYHCCLNHKKAKENNMNEKAWVSNFRDNCNHFLKPKLRKGFRVLVVMWDKRKLQDDFHARYIMTDQGAMKVDSGLDIADPKKSDASNKNRTTDVDWVSPSVYTERWNDLSLDSQIRKPMDTIEIIGQ